MVLANDIINKKNNTELNNNISHIDNMIKHFDSNIIKTRDYQSQLFKAAIKQNIICFMPTGSGKTRIAIKFIEHGVY